MIEEEIRLDQTKKVFEALADFVINGSGSYRYLIYDKLGFECKDYADLIAGLTITNAIVELEDLREENQKLKQQLDKYENPEDMTLMMMWCTEKVKDENQALKKQLEDKEDYINKLQATKDKLDKWDYENTMQQKEFIKWLENGIEKVKNTEFLDERIQRAGLIAYNRCLRKYKKITQTE